MTSTVTIRFDGRPLALPAGEPLAAALWAAGHRALRTTAGGAPRGAFCATGTCHDCLVVIDGVPGRRACMERVAAAMAVERDRPAAPLPRVAAAGPEPDLDAVPVDRPQLLVIGGGPAGLAAARAARDAGVAVMLADQRPLPPLAGVAVHGDTPVWGAWPPLAFAATIGGTTRIVQPAAAIVATGGVERVRPVPGWTLPGVTTADAARRLWRAGQAPGRRVLVAGDDPANPALAAALSRAGATVVLADTGPLRRPARATAVRLRPGTHVARIDAAADRLRVTLAGARPAAIDVDAVCLGHGLHPAGELLRLLDCAHRIDAGGGRVAVRDADGGTGVDALFAAGGCVGTADPRAAAAEGLLAGLAAAERLGLRPSPAAGRARDRARRLLARDLLARHRRAAAAPARLAVDPPADTILCRCEAVTFAAVDAARGDGHAGAGAIKRATRCGMGRCQGRYCAPVLEARLGGRDAWSGFAPRMPVLPVAFGDLGP